MPNVKNGYFLLSLLVQALLNLKVKKTQSHVRAGRTLVCPSYRVAHDCQGQICFFWMLFFGRNVACPCWFVQRRLVCVWLSFCLPQSPGLLSSNMHHQLACILFLALVYGSRSSWGWFRSFSCRFHVFMWMFTQLSVDWYIYLFVYLGTLYRPLQMLHQERRKHET